MRSGIIAIKFDRKSFFSTIFRYSDECDFEHYNEDISQKSLSLNTSNKIHLKSDVVEGSIVSGLRQPRLFSFVLDMPSGYKVFCEPETLHHKQMKKSVLNTTKFYLEDDNNKEFTFNGETWTFTLQMFKI